MIHFWAVILFLANAPITILLSISTQEAALLSTLTFNYFFCNNYNFFQISTLTFLNLNIKMKKGLKTHIWGPNKKKKEKSKQKHRSQVRGLLTNTWFLGGGKPVQTQSQFEFFFFALSSKSSSFQTWCSLRFVFQCHNTIEICIKQNSLFWWRTADRAYKEEIWGFLRTALTFTVWSL